MFFDCKEKIPIGDPFVYISKYIYTLIEEFFLCEKDLFGQCQNLATFHTFQDIYYAYKLFVYQHGQQNNSIELNSGT